MNGHRKQSKKTGLLDRYETDVIVSNLHAQSMKDIYILKTQHKIIFHNFVLI